MAETTVSVRLVVDRALCAGHGMCYGMAPELIDCDDQGDPILPETPLSAEDLGPAQTAISACPEQALSLHEVSNEEPA